MMMMMMGQSQTVCGGSASGRRNAKPPSQHVSSVSYVARQAATLKPPKAIAALCAVRRHVKRSLV